MTISKDFRFPVVVRMEGEQCTCVSAAGVDDIEVATAPEFNGPGGRWSPEQLLVASAASCFTVTFEALCRSRGIPLSSLEVSGTGHLGHRDDGRLGFVAVELTPKVETEVEFVAAAERTARTAGKRCFVTDALDVPVRVTPRVRAVEPAPAKP